MHTRLYEYHNAGSLLPAKAYQFRLAKGHVDLKYKMHLLNSNHAASVHGTATRIPS